MDEDWQPTLAGVTPEMLACFRMVVSEELAKRDSGVAGAGAGVAGAGTSSSDGPQEPHGVTPGEWCVV